MASIGIHVCLSAQKRASSCIRLRFRYASYGLPRGKINEIEELIPPPNWRLPQMQKPGGMLRAFASMSWKVQRAPFRCCIIMNVS